MLLLSRPRCHAYRGASHRCTHLRASSFLGWLTLVAVGCGGAPTPQPAVGTVARVATTSAPPRPALTGLPARGFVPPVGVLGSRSVKLVVSPAFEACQRTPNVQPAPNGGAISPIDAATALVRACASATKMTVLPNPFTGTLSDRELGKEFTLPVAAGQCVRFYVGTAPELRSVTVGIRDSKGAQIFEDASDVIPKEGELCSSEAEQLTVSVGAGWGSGAFALVTTRR
jgi:hypothetical protein